MKSKSTLYNYTITFLKLVTLDFCAIFAIHQCNKQ